jgi:hypothetical protein
MRGLGEHYRFVKEKSNSDLSNLKSAIQERVWDTHTLRLLATILTNR